MKMIALVLVVLMLGSGTAAVLASSCGGCCGKKAPATQASAPVNTICPIMGGKIDPKVTYVYQGKTIGFCCPDCIPEFKKDPAKYMANLK